MRIEDIAWSAGIIDGEGYIVIVRALNKYRNNSSYFSLTLGVEMQDRTAIEKLHELFGGSITLRHKNEKRKAKRDSYVWRCGGITARKALEIVLPYLVVKDKQARLGIEFQNNKMNCSSLGHKGLIGRQPVPETEAIFREGYYHKMMNLNKTYMDIRY